LLQAQTGFHGGAQEFVGFWTMGHGVKIIMKSTEVNLSDRECEPVSI